MKYKYKLCNYNKVAKTINLIEELETENPRDIMANTGKEVPAIIS